MKRWRLPVAWASLLLSLVLNTWWWAGLNYTPGVGPALLEAARREAPLAWIYLYMGRISVGPLGLTEAARESAAGRFGEDVFAAVLDNPPAAIERLFDTAPRSTRFNYYATPLLLLLALILQALRPKSLHVFGARR